MKNRFLLLISKEKKIIIVGLSLSFILFLIYWSYFYTPFYSTNIKIFVRNIPKQDVIVPYGGGSIVKSESGYSNPLFNLMQIIQSENLASNVYNKIYPEYADDLNKLGVKSKKSWFSAYSRLISAKVEPSTDIIKISLEWINKSNAADLLAETVNEFKKENLKISKSVEIQQSKYLEKQLIEIGNKLDNIRKQIKEYKLANNAIDMPNESVELTRARVGLQKQVVMLKSDLSYNASKLSNLANQLDLPNAKVALKYTAIGDDPYLIKLNQDLSIAQQNYAKLQAKFTDNYPDVVAVKNEISQLKDNIGARIRESLGNVKINRGLYDVPSQNIVIDFSRTQAERAAIKSQLSSLNKGINDLLNKEALLPSKILGLEELQKQESALITAYTNVKQKQLEAKIKENEIVDNIVPLGHATTPYHNSSTLFIRFLGFLSFGFFASLGVIWIKEDIEDKWLDSKEIERVTGEKILGIIPWVKSQELLSGNFIQKPGSIMGTAYGNIATSIINRSYIENAQTLTFISSLNSRYTSSIIPNISIILARLNRSVILVDTDFTEPAKLLANFEMEPSIIKKDLPDVINDVNKYLRLSKTVDYEVIGKIIGDAIIPINIETINENKVGFYYLCANKKSDNIHDYVATQGFLEIMNFLKKQYEFILIDTPSKHHIFPEITTIAGVSDATVLVSAVSTNRKDFINLIDKIKQSNVKILGIIPREENSELEKYFNVTASLVKSEQNNSKAVRNEIKS